MRNGFQTIRNQQSVYLLADSLCEAVLSFGKPQKRLPDPAMRNADYSKKSEEIPTIMVGILIVNTVDIG